MLTLTENASTIVRDITAQPEHADTTGLRISTDGDPSSFTIAPVGGAEPADLVVEQSGATVFLDQGAAEVLDDKVLDAVVDDQGRVEFALAHQG